MTRLLKRIVQRLILLLPLMWSRALRYRVYVGRWPRIQDPRGINEKINWRVLYDHREIWDWTCDKLLSKQIAAERSPGILIPEVIWSGTDLNELADLDLPARWILKSNRSSKDVVLGAGAPDLPAIRTTVAQWDDFQWRALGESAYGKAAKVAVLEKWITDGPEPPIDYKILVFHGVARYVHVHRARFSGHRSSLYTREWERVPSYQTHILPDEIDVPRPEHFDELLHRAEQIAEGFDMLRVDLFDTHEGVWFGETTPYSWSGLRVFLPTSVELELGSYWTLPDLPTRRVPRRPMGG